MTIIIERRYRNELYTQGLIFVNGTLACHTIESTKNLLPEGEYRIKLAHNQNSNRKQITILALKSPDTRPVKVHTIRPLCSWKSAKKHNCICIGSSFFPGLLKKCNEAFDPLFKRIEKAIARKKTITFEVIDTYCKNEILNNFWTEPSHHYNRPTRVKVESNSDGLVTIYFPNGNTRQINQNT